MAANPTPQVPNLFSVEGGFSSIDPDAGGGAALLFQETFESALQSGSTLENNAEVVSNEPFSGTKCLRVNLKDGVSDPFVAVSDNTSTYAYRGDVLSVGSGPSVFTIRFMVRFDDATWEGSSGFSQNSPSEVDAKAGYYGPAGDIVQRGFYAVFSGGTTGTLKFADNGCSARGDCGWENEAWAVPGRTLFFLHTNENWGAGTGWHTFEMTVNTSHADYNQVKLKMDGIVATNTYAEDGIVRVPKTWYVEEFSTIYASPDNTDLSVDRTESACGVQFDNIEIYSGEPSL